MRYLFNVLFDFVLDFFFQLEIKGGVALDMEGEDVKVVVYQVVGDNIGRVVVYRI